MDRDRHLRHNRRRNVVIFHIKRATACLAFTVALGIPAHARAVDLHNVLTGYALSSWTEGDGRALGGVSALAQDVDGDLWLGTSIGLVRFDGWRFTQWETISRVPLPRSPIVALCAARNGTLWIGFTDGTVQQVRGTELLERRSPNRDDGPISSLSEDHNGTIWMASGWESSEVLRRPLGNGHA